MKETLDRFVQAYFDLLTKEEELRIAKEQFKIVSETDLPEAMDAVMLDEVTHEESGIRVRVSDDIHINVTKKDMKEACQWFINHGFPEIVKTNFTVSFGSNEAEATSTFAATLKDMIYQGDYDKPIEVEQTIHGKTLKSFAFKKLRKGELQGLPFTVAVYVPRIAAVVKE